MFLNYTHKQRFEELVDRANQIVFKGKYYNLGRYENKEDAIIARKDAEEKLHKSFLIEKGLE